MTAAAFGEELAPGSPEHQWIQLVIAAVEKHTGTLSRWNGKLYLEPDPENLGTAHHDGTMTISARLFERLESAYRGRPQSAEDLYWLRDAVVTAIHEAKHLSSELGDPSAPGATPIGADDVRALEEGRAEQWAHEHANDIIREIRMDKYVPGVIGPPNADAYRAYSGAEAQLAHGLAQIADVKPEEIRRLADTTERTQRWNRLADLIIDQRLANNRLMPPEHRDTIRQGIVTALRDHYAPVRAVQLDQYADEAWKFEQGMTIGRNAVIAVARQVDHAEAHYRAFYAQQAAAARVQPEAQVQHYQKFLSGQPPAGRHARSTAGAVSEQYNRRSPSRDHQPER